MAQPFCSVEDSEGKVIEMRCGSGVFGRTLSLIV